MTGNQVVSAMFDIKASIHMVKIVLAGNWNKEPEWLGFETIVSYAQVVFGDHSES